jgi:hypothetical protein
MLSSIPRADDLRLAVLQRITPAIRACGLEEHEVSCQLTGGVSALHVEITGPPALRSVEHAIVVRVLDAVHAHGGTFGSIDVTLVT